MDTAQLIGLLSLLAGMTVFFLLYAIYAPVVNVQTENKELKQGIWDEDEIIDPQIGSNDSIGKYVRPILNNFLPQLPKINLSEERKSKLNRMIITSGNPWRISSEEFIGLQIAFAVIGFMGGLLFLSTGVAPEIIPPYVWVLFAAGAGYLIPYSKYNSAKEARTKEIEKQLPEALDLLTITLESGQVFEFALESVTSQLPEGLLKTEFGKVVVELQAGSSLERSFKLLAHRFESEDLESFTKAVIQATKLGSDVSETLKQQADYVRSNYEARLQRMIARLETTMFIPLIATMLPAFMLILLAPTISQIFTYL